MNNTATKKHILIVDDDPTTLKLLEGRIQAHGYDVEPIEDASEGLQAAFNKVPDLIILDVMMPIINGYNFCRLLKSQERYKEIPIVFLTSRDRQEDLEIGKEMGADAYFTKPVVMDELLDKIKELLT